MGVSYAYIQSLPTSTLQAYSEKLSKYRGGTLDNIVKRELDSRKMDALIQAKGVSLPKDIVLTRRVQNTELMAQEIRSQGFYTQQGFMVCLRIIFRVIIILLMNCSMRTGR